MSKMKNMMASPSVVCWVFPSSSPSRSLGSWCGRREAQATGRLTPLAQSLRTLNSNLQSKPEITLPNA
ncbi:hypothetical protein AAFF_G00177710, partial [Aldrovandia affinis]